MRRRPLAPEANSFDLCLSCMQEEHAENWGQKTGVICNTICMGGRNSHWSAVGWLQQSRKTMTPLYLLIKIRRIWWVNRQVNSFGFQTAIEPLFFVD